MALLQPDSLARGALTVPPTQALLFLIAAVVKGRDQRQAAVRGQVAGQAQRRIKPAAADIASS